MRLERGIIEAGFLGLLAAGMLAFLLLMARPIAQSRRTKTGPQE